MHDPHVRYPHDPGPIVFGAMQEPKVERSRACYISREEILRYSWPAGDDPDVVRIRTEIAEGGKGLWVMRLGETGMKSLVEGYYPEDIRSLYYERHLNRFQKADMNMGRLVVVGEITNWFGELPPQAILMIRRNHRNARRELKRAYNMEAHKKALLDAHDAEDEKAMKEWQDFYTDAVIQTVEAHKIKNTPKRR